MELVHTCSMSSFSHKCKEQQAEISQHLIILVHSGVDLIFMSHYEFGLNSHANIQFSFHEPSHGLLGISPLKSTGQKAERAEQVAMQTFRTTMRG